MIESSILASSTASPSASVTQPSSGELSSTSTAHSFQDKGSSSPSSSIVLPSPSNSLRNPTAKPKKPSKSTQGKESNARSTELSLESTSPKAYSPSSLRTKVLHELRHHRLARDFDQIQVFSALRYRRNATILIRFNLAGSIGDEGDTLLLYPTSEESQVAEDGIQVQPPTQRNGTREGKIERTSIPTLMSPSFTEDDDPDPAYFNIMNSKDADKQVLKLTRMGYPNDIKSNSKLSLDRIVVLALTISSQPRERSREKGRGEIFLDAMWKGLEVCVGDLCLSNRIPADRKDFGGNLIEFHFDVWQVKQERSSETPQNDNVALLEKIRMLEEKRKALQAWSAAIANGIRTSTTM